MYNNKSVLVQAIEFPVVQKNSRKKKMEIDKKSGFHDSMKYLLFTSQIFALFPLNGVLRSNHKNMYFSWCRFRTFYSIAVSCISILEAFGYLCFFVGTNNNPGIHDLNEVVFYSRGSLTCLAFLKLAKTWPSLMKDFERIEKRQRSYPPSTCLHTKLRIITLGIFFAAAVEYFADQSMAFMRAFRCENTLASTLHRFFAYIAYWKLFLYIPYSIYLGLLFQMMHIITVFGWTFIDVFIVHTGINFSEKLVQLNKQICLTGEKQVSSPTTWKALRENYTQLLHLFENFNKNLNNIILISFTSNIYFLLSHVFVSLKSNLNQEIALHHVYFIFTISLLISRTSFVCFYGASIQEESYNLLKTLVSTPSNLYNEELERFIVQVNTCPMVLSGRKYFYITRSLILKIAGSIVTYELVMIQFSDNIAVKTDPSIC